MALVLIGCGGGGASPHKEGGLGTSLVQPTVRIAWPAQARDVGGPSSAYSVRVALGHYKEDGSFEETAAQVFDRGNDPTAHTSEVKIFSGVPSGDYVAQFKFYSASGSGGSLVGQASASTNLGEDGAINLNLVATPKVARVRVVPGQNVAWQAHKPLDFEVKDADGAVLAIDPKVVAWQSGDESAVRFEDGQAVGVMGGAGKPPANVTATVDGVTSPAMPVGVPTGVRVFHFGINETNRLPVVTALSEDGSTVLGRVGTGGGWRVATLRIGSGAAATPVGPVGSYPVAISRDGSTVLYQIISRDDSPDRFCVTGPSGTVEIPTPEGAMMVQASGLSGDGSTVVGSVYEEGFTSYHFRWTRAEGMKKIFQSGPFAGASAIALVAISSDGRVIAGTLRVNSTPVVAVSVDGNETLSASADCRVKAISDVSGGSKIAAYTEKTPLLISNGTATTLPLDFIGIGGIPTDITPDGSLIVGIETVNPAQGPSHPVVWSNGAIQEFRDLLKDKAGYQIDPGRQYVTQVLGVSADKKTFLASNYVFVLP